MAKTPQVLIADDDPDGRVETRKVLQRIRFEIAGEVGLGTEAISWAKEVVPDVILLAIEEPVARALETAENLGNVLPQTPLIFYSSSSDSESVRRALLKGARDYLTRPLQGAALGEAITNALEFEEKRQMRQAGQLASAAVRGTVITVTGAKGGIGKSVLAVNLAVALKGSYPRKVVIVDADTQFGDAATMLNLKPETTASDLLEQLDGVDRWSTADYLTPGPDGLQLLAAPDDESIQWTDRSADDLRKIIDLLALSNDFVVIDTSGSFDSHVRSAIDASTLVLLVTTGEVSSVLDTKRGLQRMTSWQVKQEKIKVVLNRGARSDGLRIKDLEESLGVPIFWELPRDKAVPRTVQLGRPIVLSQPKSPVARSVFQLARTLGGARPATKEASRRMPFLSALRPRAPRP